MIERIPNAGALPEPAIVPTTPKPIAAAPGFAADVRLRVVGEPETRVAKPYDFGPHEGWFKRARAGFWLLVEAVRTAMSPGEWLCRKSDGGKHGIRRLREGAGSHELALQVQGIQKRDDGWTAAAIRNPGDPEGRFDPYAYLPTIAFHRKEDSFPVLPDGDGTQTPNDDVKGYEHGVIGGAQPLRGAVSVARKGEFTVVTYSLFYVDNKAGSYHDKDSSTVAVYLKPDATGRLAPAFLYTSWHYGANLSPWDDVKKGADGRPIVRVERGSHAVRPLASWEPAPASGVVVAGDGSVTVDGQPAPHRLTFVSPQPSFRDVEAFEAGDPRRKTLMNTYYRIYQERTNPVHPSLFGFEG